MNFVLDHKGVFPEAEGPAGSDLLHTPRQTQANTNKHGFTVGGDGNHKPISFEYQFMECVHASFVRNRESASAQTGSESVFDTCAFFLYCAEF